MKRAFLLMGATALLSACAKPPEAPGKICASQETLVSLHEMMYNVGQRQIERDAVQNTELDWAPIKAQFPSLKSENLFTAQNILFKGKDAQTGMVTCLASIAIRLPDKYRTDEFKDSAAHMSGTTYPDELFANTSFVPVTYTVQRNVTGDRDIVSSDDMPPIGQVIAMLAFAKWRKTLLDDDGSANSYAATSAPIRR